NSTGATVRGGSILMQIAKEKNCSLMEAAKSLGLDYSRVQRMNYLIEWRTDYEYSVSFISDGVRVSSNREAALKFAADLADGLLILVEADMMERRWAEEMALGVLADALPPEEGAEN